MLSTVVTTITLLVVLVCGAFPAHGFKTYDATLQVRQASNSSASLQVDLGYEIYEGFANSSTGLNVWRGYKILVQMLKLG